MLVYLCITAFESMPVQATQLDVEQSNAVIIEPTEQNHWQNLYSRHLEHLLF